ncbi:hypothetical protein D3C76_1323680 [compost metagenome]
MNQLIHQVLPIVIDWKTRVVGMLRQVKDLIIRRQRGEELAIGPGRKAVGMGEEDLLRHGRRFLGE